MRGENKQIIAPSILNVNGVHPIILSPLASPDSEGEIVGVEKHEVEASEKDNLATSFENGANNNDGADAAAAVEVKRELTVSSLMLIMK